MKLKWIHIKNYRSCNDVKIQLGPMHALLQALLGEEVAVSAEVSIKDQYACFPSKWEVDIHKEIENVEQLTAEARNLFGIQKGSGNCQIYFQETNISRPTNNSSFNKKYYRKSSSN